MKKNSGNAHWRSKIVNALLGSGILLVAVPALALYANLLAGRSFLSFPFLFYYAAQGAFLVMIFLTFWLAGRQENDDRQHGSSRQI